MRVRARARARVRIMVRVRARARVASGLGLGLAMLRRMIENIAKNPAEAKYRKVRLSNPKVAEGLVHVPGVCKWMRTLTLTLT